MRDVLDMVKKMIREERNKTAIYSSTNNSIRIIIMSKQKLTIHGRIAIVGYVVHEMQ